MGMVEEILGSRGVDIGDLLPEEKTNLFKLLEAAEKSKVTPDKLGQHLRECISAIERELVVTSEFEYFFFGLFKRVNRAQIYMKARLHNYIFLEYFITSPTRARRQLEQIADRLKT